MSEVCLADFCGRFCRPDGVTMLDSSLFATHWLDHNCDLSSDYCEGRDLDLSGVVQINDLEAFAGKWLSPGAQSRSVIGASN